jgi:hypothetical protein
MGILTPRHTLDPPKIAFNQQLKPKIRRKYNKTPN